MDLITACRKGLKSGFLKIFPGFILIVSLFFPIQSVSAADYWPGEQWRTATPESQGMRSGVLADMLDLVWQENLEMDSILIIRNGYVVMDTYHFPRKPDSKHNIFSCTKSISSTMIGIAMDKGYIRSVHDPLLDFFPEKTPGNPDEGKHEITLKHVLQMATGLGCRDSYLYQWRGMTQMRLSEDWVQYMIDLPLVEPPGTRFEYCNGASFLLTAIIEKITGKTGIAFAKEHLFTPLGIKDIYWPANMHGQTIGWGQLHLRPRDMARFGYLFLNNGNWEGRQLVSAQWVADATRKHVPATPMAGYGYQWWVMSPERYAAMGYRGQRIFVLKDKNMVVVFTGRLKGKDLSIPEGILNGYILPAVQSDGPLPEDKEALDRLRFLDRFWQTASYMDRDKRRKELAAEPPGPKLKRYVNKAFGFSVAYDAKLVVGVHPLEPPFVFRKTGIRGLPGILAAVDDIPQGLDLEKSEQYVTQFIEGMNQFSDIHVNHKEMIRLADGTTANYFEICVTFMPTAAPLVLAGVVGYKGEKMICVVAMGPPDVPMEYLKRMVQSLKFDAEKTMVSHLKWTRLGRLPL